MNDDDQAISTANDELVPLILWYNYYDDDYNLLNEEIAFQFQEKIFSNIEFYSDDKNKLVKDIRSLSEKEKVFLILSGRDSKHILSFIHDLSSLDSIFIYCYDKTKYDYLKQKYFKIVGIINPLELIHSIEKQRRRLEMQQIKLSLYADKNLKTIRFLSIETSPSFVWYQLFKNIIRLNQEDNSRIDTKNEMIKLCKAYHSHKDKKQIDDFDKTYSSHKAIDWYTKDIFLYRFVNRALRTENISDLFALRYYIVDLSENLKKYQQEQIKSNQIPSKVYRGQRATMDEIEQFKANIGYLISSNGYLSTTRKLEVAKINAGFHENIVSIIFRIKINKNVSTKNIFAYIYKYSRFPEEREVLFDIGAVFKLQSIKPYENNTWLIQLELSNKEQEQADTYIAYKMKEFHHLPNQLLIGRMFIEVGQYQQAKKYLTDLQDKKKLHRKLLAPLYQLLGEIEFHLNNNEKSLKHFDDSYHAYLPDQNSKEVTNLISDMCYFFTMEKNLPKIFKPESLSLYFNRYRHTFVVNQQLEIDSVLDYVNRKYDRSLNVCFYLLKRYKKKQTNDYVQVSRLLKRISLIYTHMDQSILASKFNKCAMNFFESILPGEHPQIKQLTNSDMSSTVNINETTDSIISEYYLPITHKVSKYFVEFESKNSLLTVQPLETLHDVKLKIKELYPTHNEIDCFIIDDKKSKVRLLIYPTQTPIIIHVDLVAENEHKSFPFNMNSHDRIEILQDKIEESMKIPFYQQNLEYQDQNLFSYKLLSDYDIGNNSTIVLKQCRYQKDTTVYIDIISINDHPVTFKRKISLQKQTIFDLKKEFEYSLGIPFDYQQLSYNDILLNEDEQLLQYYEIPENSIIILSLRQSCLPKKIFIEYFDTHTFEIQSYKNIEELKKLIQVELKIEIKYQKLIINHIELENDQFINVITQDSIIKLIDRRLISVQIYFEYEIDSYFIKQTYENDDSEDTIDYRNDLKKFLLTKQNIRIPLSLQLGNTIKDVKQLIEDKEKVSIEHQILRIKDEKNLSHEVYNSTSLIDNHIIDQSVLILRVGDFANLFGVIEDQNGPFIIEMIDEESHQVSNIKMKLARRYNITDIDSKSLFIQSSKTYTDSPLIDTDYIKHNDILTLKPRPISDSTNFAAINSCNATNIYLHNQNDTLSSLFKENWCLQNLFECPFRSPQTFFY